jgi:DNA polymerase I-like protein with 3'-5' exonuclease and polymerase domains
MNTIILDVETTIHANGNPFSERNKLCYVGLHHNNVSSLFDIEYSGNPYREQLNAIQNVLDNDAILVGFNIKFDLHWIRKYGISFVDKRIWDCQLVHFILTNQQNPYPSLNGVAEYYGLGSKLDVVATEYWGNGIDTPDVPKDILEDYLKQDLLLTEAVFKRQYEEVMALPSERQRLISLHNQDLLVLEEMEYNGILFDEDRSLELGALLEKEVGLLDEELAKTFNIDGFNFNSKDHLSCLLYGGRITIPKKEVIGVYKTGERKGQVKEGWKDHHYDLPRLIEPLKGSELKKDGYYSTDEQTLRSLRSTGVSKGIIQLILKRSGLEKRRGTYYSGLPELRENQGWSKGSLHGQLNQCVARTGRLSSSKPNLQNFDGEIKELFYSRFI